MYYDRYNYSAHGKNFIVAVYCLYPLFFNLTETNFLWNTIWAFIFSVFLILSAMYLDYKKQKTLQDYALWLYICGIPLLFFSVVIFFQTLWLGYLMGVVLIFVGLLLKRKVIFINYAVWLNILISIAFFH